MFGFVPLVIFRKLKINFISKKSKSNTQELQDQQPPNANQRKLSDNEQTSPLLKSGSKKPLSPKNSKQ